MRIAFCDDSPRDRADVCGVLKKMGLEADVFENGEALQAAFWQHAYDLVLLDIEMPGSSGYDLALVLKKQHAPCEIVFITDHMELVLDAFQFKPAAFVPKQLLKAELPRVLERILAREDGKSVYVTRKKSQDRIVELGQVIYLKYVYDHEVEFTLKDGSHFSETGSMKQFETELSPKGFIRIYSNCMVNALYIVRLEKDAVILANGEQLAIARERRETVRKAYMEYLMRS